MPTRGDAVRTIRITLETLSERLGRGEAEDRATQLPDEIGRHLSKVEDIEPFEWQKFVDRLVEKGGYDPDDKAADAIHHDRSVIDVVEETATAGELGDVPGQLPGMFEELFVLADQAETLVEEEQRPDGQR